MLILSLSVTTNFYNAAIGNPLEESNQETFRDEAMKKLPKIKKLDGKLTLPRTTIDVNHYPRNLSRFLKRARTQVYDTGIKYP